MVGMDRGGGCGYYGPLFMEIGEIFVSIMKRQHGSSGVSEFDLVVSSANTIPRFLLTVLYLMIGGNSL